MPFRILTDDDIFISYAHFDASKYAAGLADELRKRRFSCFIDQLGSEPGKDLPKSLRRKIRGCSMFVVLGTERAGTRETIENEINEFLHTRQLESIVPVDFNRALYNARWYHLIQGIPSESEKSKTALEDGRPSPSVVSRIENAFKFKRRNQRLSQLTLLAALLFLLLIFLSAFVGRHAMKMVALATEASTQLERTQAEAEVAKHDRDNARDGERLAKASADREKERAEKAALEVQEKSWLAKVAVRRAEEANEAARQATDATKHQQAISNSLIGANQSQRALAWAPRFLPSSVELAVDALKKFPTFEADSALREGLSLLPRRKRTEQYSGNILDANLSPDGQHLVILTSENVLRIYRSGDHLPLREFAVRDRKAGSFDVRKRLVALSNGAAYAAVVSGNEAIVVDLKSGGSHGIRLVEEGFSTGQIAMSPDGKYIALAYGRRSPSFSGAQVLDAVTGKVIRSFSEDLDIVVSTISFGPGGDLVFGGSLRLPSENTSGPRIIRNARRVIAWPLSAKAKGRQTTPALTREDFGLSVETHLPVAPGELALAPSDSIAIAGKSSIIATQSVVYKITGEREYAAIAYIPYTNSKGGTPSSERRYAFSGENTLIVLTAGSLPSISEWQLSDFGSLPFQNQESLARTSRSSWSLEWWDVGGYPARVSQGQPILNLKFESDNQGIRVMQGRGLQVQCLRRNRGDEIGLVEVKQPQIAKPVLAFSPELEFMVTVDNKTVSILKACEPLSNSVPFTHNLKELSTATITADAGFLALASPIGKGGADVAIDVYRLNDKQYEFWKRVQPISVGRWRPIVGLSSDGQYMTISTDQGFKLWDLASGREIMVPGLEAGGIKSMWLSPDSNFVVVFDIDAPQSASTRVLRLEDRAQIAIFKYPWKPGWLPPQIAFSPSGRVFLEVGSSTVARLVALKTGRVLHLFDSIGFAYNVAFSADESYLAIATQDREVLVYRTHDLTGGPVARLQTNGLVGGLAISPDNRYVATGNKTGDGDVLRLWPLQPDELIKEATERLSIIPKSVH